jgi:hypothetical protein
MKRKMRWIAALLASMVFLNLSMNVFPSPAGAESMTAEAQRPTALPEGVTELELHGVLGWDAYGYGDVWMLSENICVMLRVKAFEDYTMPEEYDLLLLDIRDGSLLSRTPIPTPNGEVFYDQGEDDGVFFLRFVKESEDWHETGVWADDYFKVFIGSDGAATIGDPDESVQTVMPGGKTAIREANDGSLYAVDIATGEEELLIQGVADGFGTPSYESYLNYIPTWDDAEYDEDVNGNPIPFPMDEDDFYGDRVYLFRDFSVYRPLDEHRFVYAVEGWESGAGYGVYDLQTRTDHRVTGQREYFCGMGGNTLYGVRLMADASTYESSPLPEGTQEQFHKATDWTNDSVIDYDISPDGKLFALWEETTWDSFASTVTITDISTGKTVATYDSDDAVGMVFQDDTHMLLFRDLKDGGSPYMYLIEIEE